MIGAHDFPERTEWTDEEGQRWIYDPAEGPESTGSEEIIWLIDQAREEGQATCLTLGSTDIPASGPLTVRQLAIVLGGAIGVPEEWIEAVDRADEEQDWQEWSDDDDDDIPVVEPYY